MLEGGEGSTHLTVPYGPSDDARDDPAGLVNVASPADLWKWVGVELLWEWLSWEEDGWR
jgi:hypothetical protein